MKWSVICGAPSKADATRIVVAVLSKATGETGSFVPIRRTHGGLALFQYSSPSGVVITGPCFRPVTGLLARHQEGRILMQEVQGL
jgi:invasion protein IalB